MRVACASIRSWRLRAGIRFAICSPSSSGWTALRRARPAGRRRSTCTKRPTLRRHRRTARACSRDDLEIQHARRPAHARRRAPRADAAVRAVSTASSAATAASAARSTCPMPVDARAHHRRPARRRADGDVPEGSDAPRAAHPHLVDHERTTPDSSSLLLLAVRLRGRPGAHRPDARGRRSAARRTRAAPAAGRHAGTGRHRRAARCPTSAAIAERTVPAVVNISSQQVVRRRTRRSPTTRSSGTSSATPTTSSGRGAASRAASAPASSSAPTATSSPTTTSSPASRDAISLRAAATITVRSPTSARCRRRSSASIRPPTWRC